MKITPTIGRVVHYRPSEDDRMEGMDVLSEAPCTALVAFVHSDTRINLVVFDHLGNQFPRRDVPINIERYTGLPRAEWMAYQVGQAAKHAGSPEVIAAGRAS